MTTFADKQWRRGRRSRSCYTENLIHVHQAAVFRSENIRLQDEYYSIKSRLSNALDTQQDLLRKNHDLQTSIGDLQASMSVLEQEVSGKDSSISFLKVCAQQICWVSLTVVAGAN